MSTVTKNIDYSGSYQTLTVTQAFGSTMTAYLWGAGGGGGHGDGWSGIGGAGGGGGYSKVTFSVKPSDVVGIAVGQGGTRGANGRGVGGGAAGAGYNNLLWSSLNLLSLPGVIKVTNGRYSSFLNQYGVWKPGTSFDQTVAVYFPESGNYVFTGSCDSIGYFYLDEVEVLYVPNTYTTPPTVSAPVYVTAGFHNVRLLGINISGPAGIGLTITGDFISYSGAVGGNAGPAGTSGGGGGGGGATVLTLNGNIIGVAGGGGGGGGAGRFNFNPNECNAPGLNTRSASKPSGQAGESYSGDGGGGGAGGGGYRGGNGGPARGYEATGFGGAYGSSYSSNGETQNPSGRDPGGNTNPLKPSTVGIGGLGFNPYAGQANTNGTSGYAVFEYNIVGSYINTGGNVWSPLRDTFIHHDGQWNVVKNTFINVNGQWKAVVNSTTNIPNFVSQPADFGVSYRSFG